MPSNGSPRPKGRDRPPSRPASAAPLEGVPLRFPALWARIVRSLRRGGRSTGQLLGDRDDWSPDPALTSFTQADAEALLAGLDVEDLWEEETDSVTPRGEAKHWHLFHAVARRP